MMSFRLVDKKSPLAEMQIVVVDVAGTHFWRL